MRLCLCLNWKEEQDRIVKLYEEMREDEVVSSLGPTEKKLFDIQTQTVIDKVNDSEKAIELTKQQFEEIENELQDAKDQAIEQNTKRLKSERDEAEKQRKVQENLAKEEKTRRVEEEKRAEDEKAKRIVEQERADKEQAKAKNARIIAIVTTCTGCVVFVASGGAKSAVHACQRCMA